MNLLINRPLGQAEKQLIYELTLKKRKSKKSTMSEKQLLAKQQLARELLPHQRMGPMDSLDSLNTTTNSAHTPTMVTMMMMMGASADNQQSLYDEQASSAAESLAGLGSASSISRGGSTSAMSSSSSCCGRVLPVVVGRNLIHQATKLGGGSGSDCDAVNLISGSLGSSGCSFSRSDSSYSGSSQDSGTGAVGQMDADGLSRRTELERLELARRKKEANIRFKRSKLEHLNEELGRRLYQYEYLVAQEKALLGTCNMMLFTNEGVNNFHLMRNVPFRPD